MTDTIKPKETIFIKYSNASGVPHVKPNHADHMSIHYIDKHGVHRVIEATPTNKSTNTILKGVALISEELFSSGKANGDSPFGTIKTVERVAGEKDDAYPSESIVYRDDLSSEWKKFKNSKSMSISMASNIVLHHKIVIPLPLKL